MAPRLIITNTVVVNKSHPLDVFDMTERGIADDPWHTSRWHSALVPIDNGKRQISVTVAGQQRCEPPSGPRKPLVIIAAGLGGVAAEHVVVAQLIAPFARVLRYDRSGYGASTRDPEDKTPLSAATRIEELSAVLVAINLPPPYVLVGQSYGGMIIREFLRQRPQDVAGLVFVDTPVVVDLQDMGQVESLIGVMCGGERNRYEEINGLRQNIVLTEHQAEAQQRDSEIAEGNGTVGLEASAIAESKATLAEAEGMTVITHEEGYPTDVTFGRQPLGKGRLSVISGDVKRDFSAALAYGREHGYGNEEKYAVMEHLIMKMGTTWQKFQAALVQLTNGESRVRLATGTGRTHNLHMTRPDIVTEETRWVLAGCGSMEDQKEDLLAHAWI